MELHLSINLWVVLAILGMVAGFVVFMVGLMASVDAEGRGVGLIHLMPVGFLIFIFCAIYCLYRFGALIGFWS